MRNKLMMTAAGAGAAAMLAIGLGGAWTAAAAEQRGEEGGFFEIDREPVVIFDQSGATLLGSLHTNLVVYNDGFVSYSRNDSQVLPPPGFQIIEAETANVGVEAVNELRVALGQAGAASLEDSNLLVFDLPLSTVTFFRNPGAGARTNTFSYYAGGPYAEVTTVLFDFINEHFPPEGEGEGG